MPFRRRRLAFIPTGIAFFYGLPGHIDDGQAWLGWISMVGNEWGWWNFTLIALGVILFLYAAAPQRTLVWAVSKFRPTQRENSNPSQPKEKIYTAGTVDEILAPIGDLTSLGIQRHAEPHIGKWIPVQSTIKDIGADEWFFRVTIGKNKFSPDVFLLFARDKWEPLLETMDRGKRIAAEGKIYSVGYLGMQLVDCAIVAERENDDSF